MFIGAAAGILLALGVFVAVDWQRLDQLNSQSSAASEPAPPAERTSATDNSRPVYSYSVVPGGVRSPEELLDAMTQDGVVAEHYAGVDPAKMRAERLSESMEAHVSYRIADRVYWTSRKITLQAGEQVLTDGKTIVRGRCGNNVSVDPLLPTLDMEPRPIAFDSIINPVSASRLDPAMPYISPLTLTSSPLMPRPGRTTSGGGPEMDLPGIVTTLTPRSGGDASPGTALFSVPPPGGPTPGGPLPGDPPGDPPDDPPVIDPRTFPPGDPPPGFTPPPAPTPVPEPGTLLLVAVGVGALLARRLKKQSQ